MRRLLVSLMLCAGCGSSGGFAARDGGGPGTGSDGAVHDMAGTMLNHDMGTAAGADLAIAAGADLTMVMSGTPTSITKFSGDGAVAVEQWPGGDPLRVLLTDGNGAPVVNADVDWSWISGDIELPGNMNQSSLTDGNGIAQMTIRGEGFKNSDPFSPGVIRASCAAGSVDFGTITIHTTNLGALNPLTDRIVPDTTDVGSGKAGSTLLGAIKYQIVIEGGDFNNTPLQNVGMWTVNSNDPEGQVAAACMTYSDAQGFATCDLKLTNTPGMYFFTVVTGGYSHFDGFTVTVTP